MVRFPNSLFYWLFTNTAYGGLISAQLDLTAVIRDAALQILHCIDQLIVARLKVMPIRSGLDLLLSKRKIFDIFLSPVSMLNLHRRLS
jgi:hypothetical protein